MYFKTGFIGIFKNLSTKVFPEWSPFPLLSPNYVSLCWFCTAYSSFSALMCFIHIPLPLDYKPIHSRNILLTINYVPEHKHCIKLETYIMFDFDFSLYHKMEITVVLMS